MASGFTVGQIRRGDISDIGVVAVKYRVYKQHPNNPRYWGVETLEEHRTRDGAYQYPAGRCWWVHEDYPSKVLTEKEDAVLLLSAFAAAAANLLEREEDSAGR